jgi:integration host factor subunit alpha
MTLSRKELAAILSEKGLFPAVKSAEFVDFFFEAMVEALERGEKIRIPGFGIFNVRGKKARLGRNPKTGKKIEISARRVVSFKPSGVLRKALTRGETHDEKWCRCTR